MLPIFLTFFDRTAMGAFGDDFCFTLITNQAALAAEADAAGVDQIGIDIERMNKVARQRYLPNARISDHEISDLDRLSPVVRRAALFARLNALHDNSNQEVEAALAGGATVLMLPFFSMPAEAERFVRLVDRRAKVTLLLETAAAVVRLHDILAVGGIDEVIVGLNDLRLSLGVTHEFEVVPSDLMTMIADSVRAKGIRFGFGGLARAFDDRLPISSDLVIAQHARLSSSSSWLSRSFFSSAGGTIDLGLEVARLRQRLSFWASRPANELADKREELRRRFRVGLIK